MIKHLYFLIISIILSSCSKYEIPEKYISLSSSEVSLNSDGDYTYMYIESNGDWSVDNKLPDWITITPLSGNGDAIVKISATENKNKSARNTNLTVYLNDKLVEISVEQAPAKDTLHLDFYDHGFGKIGGATNLMVHSNSSWRASTNAPWLSVSKKEGAGSDNIEIVAISNSELGNRSAKVTFTYSDGKECELVVWQYEKTYHLSEINKESIPEGDLWIVIDDVVSREDLEPMLSIFSSGVIFDRNVTTKFINLTAIPKAAFWSRYGTSPYCVSAPKAKVIGDIAFNQLGSIVKIDMPMVEEVGTSAFSNCYMLEEVNLPRVKRVKQLAFYNSSIRTGNFPHIEVVERSAFSNCGNIESLSMPNAISIGREAFHNCFNICDVKLPNAIEIDSDAFTACSALATIDIASVKILGPFVFRGCNSLSDIRIATNSDFITLGNFDLPNISNVNLTTSLGRVVNGDGWEIYGRVISPFSSVTILE